MCIRLDGLNKTMRDWDVAAYGRVFNTLSYQTRTPTINYPDGIPLLNHIDYARC
jgi:hypothetical protein